VARDAPSRARPGGALSRRFRDGPSVRTSVRMASASQGFHENEQVLPARTKDLHRALVSLQEELEAIDWYQQRFDASEDPELKEILAHNRDEEKEHAMMLLEWLRRKDAAFARMIELHTRHEGPIVSEGEKEEASGEADVEGRGSKGER
jgi:ferritin-like protein